jgi:hypothetical protein
VPAVELVRAEGRNEEKPLVTQVPDEERQQIAGRAIGPVDVFDDQDDGLPLAETAEEGEDCLERPRLEPLRPEH